MKEDCNMMSYINCCRLSFCLSWDVLIPIVIQPICVLIMSQCALDNSVVSLILALILMVLTYLAKFYSRSQILYYWTVSSITYIIIVFENIVVPLSEIETQENLILIFFICLALFFFNATKTVGSNVNCCNNPSEIQNGNLYSNTILPEICPVCRSKKGPRTYHCNVCQICMPKYDYHCFWLNTCVGEINQQFYVFGLLFGMIALGYASLLILTTICLPKFVLGVLLPKDCPDVSATLGMFSCFVSGIYCMELALLLFIQLVHQMWLISMGYSALEWKNHSKYAVFHSSPYSKGFIGNWHQFFKSMKKIMV